MQKAMDQGVGRRRIGIVTFLVCMLFHCFAWADGQGAMPAASAPLAPARGTDKAAVSPNAAELPANAPADWWGAARKELAERE
jgi:hypothetical protein